MVLPLADTIDQGKPGESEGCAVCIRDLQHHYGENQALAGIGFSVERGEVFGLLGPNGGGKTTLFRLMATLLPVQSGGIQLLGMDVATQPAAVRSRIGVTFQSPSLDNKLTVGENLRYQAQLYGLFGRSAASRISELVEQLGLADRISQRAEALSGGLKRRVEIAKSLLHRPDLLLLDEPSTGLDPGARHDMWQYLGRLRREQQVTILVTTHLMDEAEHCDRLAILDRGRLVALGTPDVLRGSVGGDCLTVRAANNADLLHRIVERFGVTPTLVGADLRIEHQAGHELLRDLVSAFPDEIKAVSFAKPTLEDVFIARTGHQFWDGVAQEGTP